MPACLKRLSATMALVVACLTLTTGVANADATNTSGFGGGVVVKGVGIPRGTMTITTLNSTRAPLPGHGRFIRKIDAGFTYVGKIHNLWIDHNIYSADGRLWKHFQGIEKFGDYSVAAQSWTFPQPLAAPSYGKHCATLFSQQPGYVKTWKTVCNDLGK